MPSARSPPASTSMGALASSSDNSDTVRVSCQVCHDHVAIATTYALRACDHRFCVACIKAFLAIRISEGDVQQLTCFYQHDGAAARQTCGAAIDDSDIDALVAPLTAKYHRFRLLQSNPQARQCPFCEHTQVTTGSAERPDCHCERCDRSFCFTHGNAHAISDDGETCAEYEKRQSRNETSSARVVKRISRPCPECARPIEKIGGCSHMTCSVCKAQFCWYCGETWGFDYASHYSLLRLESCNGTLEALVPFLDSSNVYVRRLALAMYYLLIAIVGWPLTIALCWAWMPYTLYAENRAIVKRARVLARFFAVQVMLLPIVGVAVVVIVVVECLKELVNGLSRGFRKLRNRSRGSCGQAKCCRARTTKNGDDGTGFVAVRDASLVV